MTTESKKIVAEFLGRKHRKAFEFAQKLAREGDTTQCGDLARCFLELLQKADSLEMESAEIVQWMENGCPVFLTKDDDIARPLGDCRLAASSFKKGLAAIGNAKKEGSIWRRT